MSRLLLGAAALALSFAALSAYAQEATLVYQNEYVDDRVFYDRFSENGQVQIDGWTNLFGDVYVEGYVYLDETDPFEGVSSEYGFEFGYDWELGGCWSGNIAAGRWMNYAGEGPEVGDWMGRFGLTCGDGTLSLTGLWGETDEAIGNGAYVFRFGRVSVTPGFAYYFKRGVVNPGAAAEYTLTENLSIGGALIYPEVEDEDTGETERELYLVGRLIFRTSSE
jgi:hypothetical protein